MGGLPEIGSPFPDGFPAGSVKALKRTIDDIVDNGDGTFNITMRFEYTPPEDQGDLR